MPVGLGVAFAVDHHHDPVLVPIDELSGLAGSFIMRGTLRREPNISASAKRSDIRSTCANISLNATP
jgi:hypothetical protein